jgi:hypothetical protein
MIESKKFLFNQKSSKGFLLLIVVLFNSNVNCFNFMRAKQLDKIYECDFDDYKLSIVCNNRFNNSIFTTFKPGFLLIYKEQISTDPGFTITDITSICNKNTYIYH